MAWPPGIKIGEWSRGSAWVLGGTPGIEQWSKLNEETRAKIEKRFQIICTADANLVDSSKLRKIGGVAGAYEAKFWEPLIRVWCFRAGAWYVTHITDKPGDNLVAPEGEKCVAWRNAYLADKKQEAEKKKAAEKKDDAAKNTKSTRRSRK